MFKFPKMSSLLKSQRKFGRMLDKALRSGALKPVKPRVKQSATKITLHEVTGFGSNPGRLTMKLYAPRGTVRKPALVVVLHGCRQTAEGLDAASGFSMLARQRGFVLLYPQQTTANSSQRCFNWFQPSAVARDRGELMSVKQMIDYASINHNVDPSRIYIVGLSAGAALVSALAATYPEMFAGAAMVAGMPFGAARDGMAALRAMRSGVLREPGEWSGLVRKVSPTSTVWPPISIWQGTADRVVNPINARSSAMQWRELAGVSETDGKTETRAWGTLTRWKAASRPEVSLYCLDGFGHGLPVRVTVASGRPTDPYVLAAGVSAPLELLRVCGLKGR